MKKLIFVCSPYSGDIQKNVEFAKQCCLKVLEEGNIPFAPHLFFTQFLDDSIEEQRKMGIASGIEMMRRCDQVHVFGNEITDGMAMEISQARIFGTKVVVRA